MDSHRGHFSSALFLQGHHMYRFRCCVILTNLYLGILAHANAALIVLDNKDAATVTTTGSQSTFGSQSFTPSIAGVGLADTVAANSPLPANVFLTSITTVRAPLATATAGQLFLDIYLGGGSGGTYIGSSLNSIDVNSATSLSDMTWYFPFLSLVSTSQYSFTFSTDNVAGGTSGVGGRIAAANFGSGFVSTYSGGVAYNQSNSEQTLDARFLATFETIPEPSSLLFIGMVVGGLCLARRRYGPSVPGIRPSAAS